MKIKVLGCDPSMSNWGMAICEVDVHSLDIEVKDLILAVTKSEKKQGVVKTSDDLRRFGEVKDAFHTACAGCSFIISEVPFFSPAAYPAANYGAGATVATLAHAPIPLIQVSPQEVKLAAVNHRQAAKEEMIEWGMARHPGAPWLMRKLNGKLYPTAANEHLADAVAAVHAGVKTQQFMQAISIYRSMVAQGAAA